MPEEMKWTHSPRWFVLNGYRGPEDLDTNALLLECIKEANVAYVAGNSFFCNGKGYNTMRFYLSY